ncbi:pentaxin domain-containing protein [Saccharobesus litoralis]|uniref:Pentaxin domain-containing protein n=1 Tax=Saccharobesus litoralis TaxID=2172099 RepID=A0A2S0VMT3_9ALTE|nr:LamG-like jellyroll fold domain-containing protein [Saccharobesus litoralis]AWB65479.1 pentaxin domain-containing protein [Saccharobesus litoralis]
MKRSDQYPEVRDIADAVCSGIATPEQLTELEQLLHEDFEAQRFYYDYVSVHSQLKSPADRNMEFIYRRMTEEFVIRPNGGGGSPIDGSGNNGSGNNTIAYDAQPPQRFHVSRNVLFIFLFIVIGLLASITWLFYKKDSQPFIAQVIEGNVKIAGRGHIQGNSLLAGDYNIEQDSVIKLDNGDELHLASNSLIKLFNDNEVRIKRGKLTVKSQPGQNTIVHSRVFIALPNGSDVSIDLTQPMPVVTSGENTLITVKRWRPTHYWSFDSLSETVLDAAGNAHGKAMQGATPVKGIVGSGAFKFDNTRDARIDVGSGGGTAPGTGSFAVTDGVTIEALVRPEYSGKLGEIDEIFRKDHGDKELRILLSFQHDSGKPFLMPEGEYRQSLSFGLFILGQGYHELKLPLDGQNGRPTLDELKAGDFQHIVATYNVKTGLKAIYINGEMLASHQYPPGSIMLSGGPGTAAIGNNPAEERWHKEAFSGVIDEVAFYDFALTPFVLKQHLQNIKQGNNYYGLPTNTKYLPTSIKYQLPANQSFHIEFPTGQPILIGSSSIN